MDEIHVGSRICLGGEGLGLYSGKAITIYIENIFVSIKIDTSNEENLSFIDEINAIAVSFKKFGYKVSTPKFMISTTIPSGYGLASSAALMYAITTAFKNNNCLNCTKEELEEIAYYAEFKILNILVGKTDTYAVSRRGMLFQDHSVIPSNIIRNSSKEIFQGYTFFIIGSHPTNYKEVGLMIKQKSIEDNIGFERYKQNVMLILPLLWDNLIKNDILISSQLINSLYRSIKEDLEINNPDYDYLINLAYKHGAIAAKNIGLRISGGSIYAIVPNEISSDFHKNINKRVHFITKATISII